MNRQIIYAGLVFCFLATAICNAKGKKKSSLIRNLTAKKKQVVVAYGTSLTSHGTWVKELESILNKRYANRATVINSGGSGKWSQWGLANLESRVIAKKPDTVFLEFSMNDSVERFKCSVEQSKKNLETMIARILKSNPKCEIILMTMTPGNGVPKKRVKIKEYYEVYRQVAKKRRFLLIDHYPNWISLQKKDKKLFKKYVPDVIHPTAEGCSEIITPFILSSIGVKIKKGKKKRR